VEKPAVEEAPSNLVIASRYVFTPEIFGYIEQTRPGKGGEIQITDAMRLMVRDHAMYGRRLAGRRCDIGNKEGFIRTNIEYALKRNDMAAELRTYIKMLAERL
jgi:UTP--glucose-1-phosphate uridylyltransferase